jgi:hypothetical protein
MNIEAGKYQEHYGYHIYPVKDANPDRMPFFH